MMSVGNWEEWVWGLRKGGEGGEKRAVEKGQGGDEIGDENEIILFFCRQ